MTGIFVLTLLAFNIVSTAARADGPDLPAILGPVLANRWEAAPRRRDDTGAFGFQAFARTVRVGSAEIPVAAVTWLRAPLPPGEDPDVGALALEMARAMGLSWSRSRTQGSARAFEGDWERGGRSIRLYLRARDGVIDVSVAVLHPTLGETAVLESEILQRSLMGVLLPGAKGGPVAWSVIRGWASREARAESAAPACTPCQGPVASPAYIACTTALVSCTYNSMSGIVSSLNATAEGFKTEWKRSNDLLDRLSKPQNLFGLAAAGAAGAAVGGFVASLAIDGIRLGAKALVKLITMEDREREIVSRFTKAREEYEKLMEASAKLETALDGLLAIKAESAGAGVGVHDLVLAYGAERAALDIREHDAFGEHARIMRTGDASCAARYYREQVAPVEERARGVARILRLLQEAETREEGLCESLGSQLASLDRITDSLNQARAHLLAGRETFLRMKEQEFADALKAVERAERPGRYGRIQDRKERRAIARATRLMRRDRRRSWRDLMRECVADREKAEPARSRLFHRGFCEETLTDPGTATGDLVRGLHVAGKTFKARSRLAREAHDERMDASEAWVTVDARDHLDGMQGWHRWFEDLAGESRLRPRAGTLRDRVRALNRECRAGR